MKFLGKLWNRILHVERKLLSLESILLKFLFRKAQFVNFIFSLIEFCFLQDTVLALQALAAFSSIVYGGKQDMTIDVAVPGMSHKFTINSDNKLVLQRVEVSFAFTAHIFKVKIRQGYVFLAFHKLTSHPLHTVAPIHLFLS